MQVLMYIDGEMVGITLSKILGCDQSKRAIGAREPLYHVTRVLAVFMALNRYLDTLYSVLHTEEVHWNYGLPHVCMFIVQEYPDS